METDVLREVDSGPAVGLRDVGGGEDGQRRVRHPRHRQREEVVWNCWRHAEINANVGNLETCFLKNRR